MCGGDLRTALWGADAIGVRRLSALVRGMSPRSAYARKYTRGQEWNNAEEMLATIAESIDVTNRILYGVYSEKGQSWKPLRIPRPRVREVATGSNLAGFFRRASGNVSFQGGSV